MDLEQACLQAEKAKTTSDQAAAALELAVGARGGVIRNLISNFYGVLETNHSFQRMHGECFPGATGETVYKDGVYVAASPFIKFGQRYLDMSFHILVNAPGDDLFSLYGCGGIKFLSYHPFSDSPTVKLTDDLDQAVTQTLRIVEQGSKLYHRNLDRVVKYNPR